MEGKESQRRKEVTETEGVRETGRRNEESTNAESGGMPCDNLLKGKCVRQEE